MSALGRHWRIQIKNATGGTSGAITVDLRRWKPGSSGEKSFEASEQAAIDIASLSSGGYSNSSTFDNSSDGYWGFNGTVAITNGSSAGNYELYVQTSTDGGTTWPSDGEGELIDTFYRTASQNKTENTRS